MKVVALETKTVAVNKEIVEEIEKLLEMAKNGEFVAFGACYVRENGKYSSLFCRTMYAAALIGASALLTSDLLDAGKEAK